MQKSSAVVVPTLNTEYVCEGMNGKKEEEEEGLGSSERSEVVVVCCNDRICLSMTGSL
jgi:hypothetical protein